VRCATPSSRAVFATLSPCSAKELGLPRPTATPRTTCCSKRIERDPAHAQRNLPEVDESPPSRGSCTSHTTESWVSSDCSRQPAQLPACRRSGRAGTLFREPRRGWLEGEVGGYATSARYSAGLGAVTARGASARAHPGRCKPRLRLRTFPVFSGRCLEHAGTALPMLRPVLRSPFGPLRVRDGDWTSSRASSPRFSGSHERLHLVSLLPAPQISQR